MVSFVSRLWGGNASNRHIVQNDDLIFSSARIVIEMKMEQVNNFQILNSVLPLSEAHLAEQIIVTCVSLTNLLPPLLQ